MKYKYSIDSDLTSVWVHCGGECVARFGKVAYEVMGDSVPRLIAHRGVSKTVDDWHKFTEFVRAIHGVKIDVKNTPIKFRDELGLGPGYDNDESLFRVPIKRLLKVGNPFEQNIWNRDQVTKERVRQYIESGLTEPRFIDMAARFHVDEDWDIRRIAHLVLNPNDWPLLVVVNDVDGDFELVDGWHRLAAAIYREEEDILISLSGIVNGWDEAFPERLRVEVDERITASFSL